MYVGMGASIRPWTTREVERVVEQHATAGAGIDTVGSEEQAASHGSMLEVLANRRFLLLWVAQIISQTAQQIINLALAVQVATITGSSTAVAGLIVSFTLPAILFAAVAGVFVERSSKKNVLVATNLARGIMVLAYVLTDANWGPGAVLLIFYVVTFLFASVSQFFNPAELAMIPLIVRRNQLVAANSLFNLSFTACQLGGFVILGPLLLATVVRGNYPVLYLILFVLYLICAALTYFLPQDAPAKPRSSPQYAEEWADPTRPGSHAGQAVEGNGGLGDVVRRGFLVARADLIEAWNFVRRDEVIRSTILYWSIAITAFMMLGAIGPNFLQKVLRIDPDQLYVILSPGGAGLVLGVLIVGRLSTPENRQAMITWSLFITGAVLVVFALVEPATRWLFSLSGQQPPVGLILFLMGTMAFVLGALNSFIGVPAQTALQERSPLDIRARVFSFFFTVQNAMLIVPVLLAAGLADSLGHVQTVALIGAAVLIIAGVGVRRMRAGKESTSQSTSHSP